jgi:hypothetical protein
MAGTTVLALLIPDVRRLARRDVVPESEAEVEGERPVEVAE